MSQLTYDKIPLATDVFHILQSVLLTTSRSIELEVEPNFVAIYFYAPQDYYLLANEYQDAIKYEITGKEFRTWIKKPVNIIYVFIFNLIQFN